MLVERLRFFPELNRSKQNSSQSKVNPNNSDEINFTQKFLVYTKTKLQKQISK